MGVVLYIGQCHLGDGLWIGVQLNEAFEKGHNGTVSTLTAIVADCRKHNPRPHPRVQVDGHKYFRCPTGQGVLRPARKVYWHGKKVSDVIDEQVRLEAGDQAGDETDQTGRD